MLLRDEEYDMHQIKIKAYPHATSARATSFTRVTLGRLAHAFERGSGVRHHLPEATTLSAINETRFARTYWAAKGRGKPGTFVRLLSVSAGAAKVLIGGAAPTSLLGSPSARGGGWRNRGCLS